MTREEFIRQEIDRYRQKIELYRAIVAELESELGIQSVAGAQAQPANSVSKANASSTIDPLSLVQGMIFFNKSQAEAGKAFLEMVGYPLRTGLILEAVEKGGLKVGGKTPVAKKQNFYTILHRSTDVALVAKDTWGIVGWPGVPKKSSEDSAQDQSDAATNSVDDSEIAN